MAHEWRVAERRLQWQREGVYMTWAEIEAGEAGRGCGAAGAAVRPRRWGRRRRSSS